MTAKNREHVTGEQQYRKLSVIILAGGRSERMGLDKAFLKYKGQSFIDRIYNEMLNISDDVVISIGTKDSSIFKSFLEHKTIRLVSDHPNYRIGNPMGGILSSLTKTRYQYVAILPCDSPEVKSQLVNYLFRIARNHSAAVPIRDNQIVEPLCAVYNSKEAMLAGLLAIRDNKIGPRHMISYLKNVQYVDVSRLKRFDRHLSSLLNINSRYDYERLVSNEVLEKIV